MTPGAILSFDDEISNTPKQAKDLEFDVSILGEHEHDARGLDFLLLAWSLLLYRHSSGEHVQFSWGLSENGTSTRTTFEFNTSKLVWNPDEAISVALDGTRSYLQEHVTTENPITAGRTFFFNDESAPAGSLDHVDESNPVSWVRAEDSPP